MNRKPLALGGFLLFCLGYGAGIYGKPTSEALDAAHDSVGAAVKRAEASEHARAAVELQARQDSTRLAGRADSAMALARAASRRQPQVIDRIVEREAPADTALARRVASTVVDSLTINEIRPRDVALAAKGSAYAVQGGLLRATEAALATERQAGQARAAEIAALRAIRPSWFTAHVVPFLKVAGAGVAGYEIGKARRP